MGKEKNWLEKKLAQLTYAQKQELFEHLRQNQGIYTAQPIHLEVLRLRFFSEEQITPTDEKIAQVLQCDPALVPVYERAALEVLDPFETTIDYTRSLQQMLDDVPIRQHLRKYSNNILGHFSIHGTGAVTIEPHFITLDKTVGTSVLPKQRDPFGPRLWPNERQLREYHTRRLQYAAEKFQEYDLRPARIEHLLAFAAQYLWEASIRDIIAPLAFCKPYPENQDAIRVAHLRSESGGLYLVLAEAIQNKQVSYPNFCIPMQDVPHERRWSLLGFKHLS